SDQSSESPLPPLPSFSSLHYSSLHYSVMRLLSALLIALALPELSAEGSAALPSTKEPAATSTTKAPNNTTAAGNSTVKPATTFQCMKEKRNTTSKAVACPDSGGFCAVIFYDDSTVDRYCPKKTECSVGPCTNMTSPLPAGWKCCCKSTTCNGGDRAAFNLTTPARPNSSVHSDEAPKTQGKLELPAGQRLDGSSVAFDPAYMRTSAMVYTYGAAFWIVFIAIMQTILVFARDPRDAFEDKNNESARLLLRHHDSNKNSSSSREVEHTQTVTEERSRKTERTQEHS
ncbi:hypothetical protein PMAYCL1PPCAC_04980, partial [Pristionchus mayeri]